jgi:hypothetical protein
MHHRPVGRLSDASAFVLLEADRVSFSYHETIFAYAAMNLLSPVQTGLCHIYFGAYAHFIVLPTFLAFCLTINIAFLLIGVPILPLENGNQLKTAQA